MYQMFKEFIFSLERYSKDMRVAVSYSGGPDSGVLLDLFYKMFSDGLSARPEIVYFNHNLRGEESKKESLFVAEAARKLNLEINSVSLNVTKHSSEKKLSIESAARELRYAHYETMRNRYDYIAQGHHADDNSETVLYNILRGSGLDGAGGIKPVRDIFIRPLLKFTKKEILEYALENSVGFVEDMTNSETDFSRNIIRNMIIPSIEKELGRNVSGSLNRFSQICSESADYISGQAEKFIRSGSRNFHGLTFVNREKFLRADRVIQKATLSSIFKVSGKGYSLNSFDLNLLADSIASDGSIKFRSSGLKVSSHGNSLIFLPEEATNPAILALSRKKFSDQYFDLSRIKGDLVAGIALKEEKFRPFGKSKEEKLSKTLSDRKIPQALRDILICLRDDEKTVFVQGCGISDEVKILPSTGPDAVMFIKVRNDFLVKLY
jgi:tRNA(Ile)-lysidine synthase